MMGGFFKHDSPTVVPTGPLTWKQRLARYFDRLWVIGRRSRWFLRFYPNPGFGIGRRRWSRAHGWRSERRKKR